jgi:predicted ATPase/class 3 adenylate cyclase
VQTSVSEPSHTNKQLDKREKNHTGTSSRSSIRTVTEAERKQVTVLFADVYGFTAISEALDPEEVRSLMNKCLRLIIEDIHLYEGTINKFTGDGVMALFGAPFAQEDHAIRAVNAALGIQKSIKSYGEELRREHCIDFKIRIGINTGLAVVGSIGNELSMDYTAMGDTINLASRLETLAEPGTILVSDNTYNLVKDTFSTKSLGEFPVKGKKLPVKAFQVLSLASTGAPLDIAKERGLTQFVGRRNEIDILKYTIAKALKGNGQVAAIIGEAGFGKSRLIFEFRKLIEEEKFTYLETRCLSYGKSTPYLPVIDLLKTYFRINALDDENVIKEKLQEGVKKIGEDLEWTLPNFYNLLSLKVDEASLSNLHEREIRKRTYDAIKAIILGENRIRPLVLVIENVHWIDSGSEELLSYLVDNIARCSITIVISSRPGYVPTFTDKSYYSQLTLGPLSERECHSVLEGLLNSDDISPELGELVLSKCGGNPFYLEEIVKDLLEEETIRKANGKCVLSKGTSKLRVPGTIHSVIMSRIDRLEEDLKKVLQYASVIGREFSLRILMEVTGIGEDIHEYLEKLKALELIYEKRSSPEPEYLFKHALTQEATYDSLLISRRKELHGSIGQILQARQRERLEDYYETLCYHFNLADNKEKALEYSVLAGDKAFRLHSTREARDYYEKAIKLTEELPENKKNKLAKIELTLKLARALRFFESPKHILKVLKEVEEPARAVNEKKTLAEILLSIGFFTVIYGRNQEDGIPYIEKSIEMAGQLADERLTSSAHYGLSMAYYFTREMPTAIEIQRKAYELNKKTRDFFEASHCLLLLGVSYWHIGDYKQAIKYLKKAREFAEENGQVTMVAHTHCGHGGYGMFYGNTTLEYVEDCQKAMKVFKELGDVYYNLIASGCYWYGRFKISKEKEAIMHLKDIINTKEENNMWIWQPMLYSFLGESYLDLNNESEAFNCSQRAIDIAKEAGNKLEEGRAWIALGNVYLKNGSKDLRKAEESLKESVKSFQKIGAQSGLGMSYYTLGTLYKDLARHEEAQRHLKEALTISKNAGLMWYLEKSTEALAQMKNS